MSLLKFLIFLITKNIHVLYDCNLALIPLPSLQVKLLVNALFIVPLYKSSIHNSPDTPPKNESPDFVYNYVM